MSKSARELALDGTTFIEASAGTGKTYTITLLVLRLVIEKDLPIERILVTTFTRAAAAELRARVRVRLREARRIAEGLTSTDDDAKAVVSSMSEVALGRIRRALANLDAAPITTIHGFCSDVLQRYAFEASTDLGLELLEDPTLLTDDLLRDVWINELHSARPDIAQAATSGLIDLDDATVLIKAFAAQTDIELEPSEPTPLEEVPEELSAWIDGFREAAERWKSGLREETFAHFAELPETDVAKRGMLKLEDGRRFESLALLDSFLTGPPLQPIGNRKEWIAFKFSSDGIGSALKGNNKAKNAAHPFCKELDTLVKLFDVRQAVDKAIRTHVYGQILRAFRDVLPARKERLGVYDYGDLIRGVADSVGRGDAASVRLVKALQGRYDAALIDEFQDTDPGQARIFEAVFVGSKPTFLVGDPKQAIYAFRGADIHAYLGVRERNESGAQTFSLETNWRSDASFIAALNSLYEGAHEPFRRPDISYVPVKPRHPDRLVDATGAAVVERLEFVRYGFEDDDEEAIDPKTPVETVSAVEVHKLLSAGLQIADEHKELRPLLPGDIAVLVRSNKVGLAVQDKLRDVGIKCALMTTTSVFQSTAATELLVVLGAIEDPSRRRRVRGALLSRFFGLTAFELAQLDEDEAAWEARHAHFVHLHELWHERGVVAAMQYLLTTLGALERVLEANDGERFVTDLRHLLELLEREGARGGMGMLAQIEWLESGIANGGSTDDVASDEAQLRLESDQDAVKITTLHRSKGLEYPIVVMPQGSTGASVADFGFERRDGDRGRVLDLDTAFEEDERRRGQREDFEEMCRLLYVGLTRARHRAVVVWKSPRSCKVAPLHHLICDRDPKPPLPTDDGLFDAAKGATKDPSPDLAQLHAATAGAIADRNATPVDPQDAPPIQPSAQELGAGPADVRTFVPPSRNIVGPGYTSFSVLRKHGSGPLTEDESESARGKAADEETAEEVVDTSVQTDSPSTWKDQPIRLEGLPRGTGFGNALHAALENIGFDDEAGSIEDEVEAQLSRQGLPTTTAPMIGTWLHDRVLRAPLRAGNHPAFTLAEVPRASRLDELEFFLPTSRASGTVSTKKLGEAMKQGATNPLGDAAEWNGYCDRVAALKAFPIYGFLEGKIDLVLRHEGRWYLADYKSNFLGETFGDYGREKMNKAMEHAHYLLQYHLYLLGLHVFLTHRMGDAYDYERDFGGVFYLFARGMNPDTDNDFGVFVDRPPIERVEALAALFVPEATKEVA